VSRLGAVKRWMYRNDRPHRLAAVLNRGWAIVASAGLGPNRLATLEIRGRRSGRLISFPVMVVDYRGERYLVSMLGGGAKWVSNVRAAGGQAVLRHGRRQAVCLEEIDPSVRGPILRRYLQVAPGARPHIPVDRRAPVAEFEQIAAQYPVFRVRADSAGRKGLPHTGALREGVR
jgi:deazaflavin-dependent oxidoreductase (nitroreductase family)